MEIFDPTLVGIQRAMTGSMLRQQVLANNLANAETPGFRRSDVDFHSALAQAMSTGDSSAVDNVTFSPEQEQTTMRADGNGVDVDVESANMAKNGLEYDALVSVAKARINILRSAMGA